jgi:hypothetical protein
MLELFRSGRRAFAWGAEALVALGCVLAAARWRLGPPEGPREATWLVLRALVATVVLQASLYYHGLHDHDAARTVRRELGRWARAIASGALVVAAVIGASGCASVPGVRVVSRLLAHRIGSRRCGVAYSVPPP